MSLFAAIPARHRIVATLAVTQLIGWGMSYDMLSLFGRDIARSLGLANETIFLGLSIMMLVAGLSGPVIGRAIARFGAAKILAGGSLAFAVGLGLLATATEPVGYFIAWTIIGIAAGLGLAVPGYAAVVERMGEDAKATISWLLIFTGLSAALFWPINSWLADVVGWRGVLWIGVAAHLFVCLPLHLLLLRVPRREQVGHESADGEPLPLLSKAAGLAAFLLLALATTVSTFITFGVSPALLEILRQAGASPAFAVQLGALRSALGITARLADLMLGKRATALGTAVVAGWMTLASFAVLHVGPGNLWGLVGFIALYGFGTGVMTVARVLMPLNLFSAGDYARLSGRLILPQNIANAVAPVAYTALIDRSGLDTVLAVSAVLTATTLVALFGLGRLARRGRRAALALQPAQ
ncbi:MAG: MFS transporter [Ancalomicrobiaceae bacterium]|nr:MFS transporter [Ancalomicrobiaceae bacterium]